MIRTINNQEIFYAIDINKKLIKTKEFKIILKMLTNNQTQILDNAIKLKLALIRWLLQILMIYLKKPAKLNRNVNKLSSR